MTAVHVLGGGLAAAIMIVVVFAGAAWVGQRFMRREETMVIGFGLLFAWTTLCVVGAAVLVGEWIPG